MTFWKMRKMSPNFIPRSLGSLINTVVFRAAIFNTLTFGVTAADTPIRENLHTRIVTVLGSLHPANMSGSPVLRVLYS